MHVWAIIAETGDYDSFNSWVDSVWSSKEAAMQERDRLKDIEDAYKYRSRAERVYYDDPLELVVDVPGGQLEDE